MALVVWFTMGLALWHFTVFVPDRFWQGIVGAFVGSTIGAMVSGAILPDRAGRGLGETDLGTALMALPGIAAGLAIVYAIGIRARAGSRLEPAFWVSGGGAVPSRAVLSLTGVSGDPSTAYRARPYDYAEARPIADELGLSEPVAITLVRRGHRTPEAGARVP